MRGAVGSMVCCARLSWVCTHRAIAQGQEVVSVVLVLVHEALHSTMDELCTCCARELISTNAEALPAPACTAVGGCPQPDFEMVDGCRPQPSTLAARFFVFDQKTH